MAAVPMNWSKLMSEVFHIIRREFIYVWYYFDLQLRQIFRYWVLGMSMGSAAAFMITGPATKITNLGALKIAMGWKRFALYIAFVMAFAFGCGLIVNMCV